jgi:hypothetical protein
MRSRRPNKGPVFRSAISRQAAQGILGLIDQKALETEPLIPKERGGNFIEKLGDSAVEMWNDLGGRDPVSGGFFRRPGQGG